ncbi:YjbH domain-containing protein [Azospirillum thermophilum]|uniref:YjbH domain-containing protein n=1 Tax=Azospirillum thermophilum TaxID=2202148 RepID=A0A2S2CM63_9PROT|nr:YjbH domain-containing protein [Azospirillum thermophilum]AWK85605.1 hypothetical protein DEW08_04980 [Azospirillum thermophilum]
MKTLAYPLLTAGLAAGVAAAEVGPSRSDWGTVGLLQVPSARMLPDGTPGAGLTVLGGLHRHLTVGAQLSPGLEVVARETVHPNPYGLSAPGLDAKLRLLDEGAWWPALAIGGRDLTGAGPVLSGKGRFAGEYLVASRRWWDLDLTLGLGWGSLGEAGHLRNPLRLFGSRFRRDRDPSAREAATGPRSWFTGERVALFGGVEWHTPVPDLSVKLEYSGDRFRAQRREDAAFRAGSGINAGLSYRPFPWIDMGVGIEQGRRVMLRLSGRLDPGTAGREAPAPAPAIGPRPSAEAAPPAQAVLLIARARGLPARSVLVEGRRAVLWLDPAGDPAAPLAREVGRAALLLAELTPAAVEELTVVTGSGGLPVLSTTILRHELERAARRRGSAEEVWRTTRIGRPHGEPSGWPGRLDLSLHPGAEVGLSEVGNPLVLRGHTDARLRLEPWRGVVLGAGLRVNLGGNAGTLDNHALPAADPVRSDLPLYTRPLLGLEHLYAAWLADPAPGWTMRLSAGQFEEMFGGVGGELLHQPLTARWAVGLDLNQVWKRPAGEPFGIAAGSGRLTGHASLYLEEPGAAATAILRAGRYLGGDWGATAELDRRFDGGWRLNGRITWTGGPDRGRTRLGGRVDYGLSLVVPLAPSGLLPVGGATEMAVRTLGRDAGQRLRQPLPLYEARVPAGYGRLAGTWRHLLD